MSAVAVAVAFVKIQPGQVGSYMVTMPFDAEKMLGIRDNERVKVLADKEKR